MPRERSFGALISGSILFLIVAVSRAAQMIGNPARWVDIFTLMASTLVAGVLFTRAMVARRAKLDLPPEIPGGPPNVPK